MIHKIIGKDLDAPNGGIESVVDVYEEHDYFLDRDFVVVEYKKYKESHITDEVYILKSIFDLTEQELVENQSKLKQELEVVNQLKKTMLCEMFNELKDSLNSNKLNLDNNDFTIEQSTENNCIYIQIYGVRENINLFCTVIKQKLTNALLRHSRRYKPFYEIESYSIVTTPHGNKVFNACWKEKDSFGVGSIIKYETVSMKDFNAV